MNELVDDISTLEVRNTDHSRGIYGIHYKSIKEKRRMSKSYKLELQTPIMMPKNLPEVLKEVQDDCLKITDHSRGFYECTTNQ